MKMLRAILLNNFSIKVISLALALFTWSYIGGQLYRESLSKDTEAASLIKVSGEKFIVKSLPIYVNIEGEPSPGYRIILDNITISPSRSVVAGPPEIIKDLLYISTAPVAVSGKAGTVKQDVNITQVQGCKIGYEGMARVIIPIKKIKRR